MVGEDKGNLKSSVFFIWGGLCTAAFVYAFFLVPETKGESLSMFVSGSSNEVQVSPLSKSTRCSKRLLPVPPPNGSHTPPSPAPWPTARVTLRRVLSTMSSDVAPLIRCSQQKERATYLFQFKS
jgi:hypothetical protein